MSTKRNFFDLFLVLALKINKTISAIIKSKANKKNKIPIISKSTVRITSVPSTVSKCKYIKILPQIKPTVVRKVSNIPPEEMIRRNGYNVQSKLIGRTPEG